MQDKYIKEIRAINPNVLLNDGAIKPFKEQMNDFFNGSYNKNYRFVLCIDDVLSNLLKDKPYLTIDIFTIRKTIKKHCFNQEYIKLFEQRLKQDVILGFESPQYANSLALFLDNGEKEKLTLCAIHRDDKFQDFLVNKISSIHYRDTPNEIIKKTWNKGLDFYANKKTRDLAGRRGLYLPPPLALSLNTNFSIHNEQNFKVINRKMSMFYSLHGVNNKQGLKQRLEFAENIARNKPPPRNKDEPDKSKSFDIKR